MRRRHHDSLDATPRTAAFPRAALPGLLALSLLAAACATGTIVVPGGEEHPADAAARVPAFRPAPDPLLAEPPPDPTPPSAMPMEEHAGHAGPSGHGAHSGSAPPGGGQTPAGHDDAHHGSGAAGAADAPATTEAAATDRLVREYLNVVRPLAKDDFASAKSALSGARTAAEELKSAAQGDLAAAAGRVVAATPRDPKSIEDLRRDLKGLSEAMLHLVRMAPPTREVAPQLRNWYCPMADAAWLQPEAEAANPYFGAEMPRCGRVTETIESRAPHHAGR